MSGIGGLPPHQALEMILGKAKGASDDASSASKSARDMMEMFSPQNVLGGLAEVFKVLGSIASG